MAAPAGSNHRIDAAIAGQGPENYILSVFFSSVVFFFFDFLGFSVVVFFSSCAGAAKTIVPRPTPRPRAKIMSFFILKYSPCWVRRCIVFRNDTKRFMKYHLTAN